MARGANFEEGNIIQKAKAMVPILVPLFVSAFRRANDPGNRHGGTLLSWKRGQNKDEAARYISSDYKAYAVMAVYLALIIVIRIFF